MHPVFRSPRSRRTALVYAASVAGRAGGIGMVAASAMVALAFEAGAAGGSRAPVRTNP